MQGLKAFSLGIMGEFCRTTKRLSNLEFSKIFEWAWI